METLLLSLHVLAAILLVGPVAVTASLFTRYAPRVAPPGADDRVERGLGTARMLHRITRGYGRLACVVPLIGLALAIVQGRAAEVWVVVAMVVTAVAGALLLLQILPRQESALLSPDDGTQLRALSMVTGLFNLLWVLVVVLMVVRPGSDLP